MSIPATAKAYFSINLNPGVVLRVPANRALVREAKSRACVAIDEQRASKFKAILSDLSKFEAAPCTIAICKLILFGFSMTCPSSKFQLIL